MTHGRRLPGPSAGGCPRSAGKVTGVAGRAPRDTTCGQDSGGMSSYHQNKRNPHVEPMNGFQVTQLLLWLGRSVGSAAPDRHVAIGCAAKLQVHHREVN